MRDLRGAALLCTLLATFSTVECEIEYGGWTTKETDVVGEEGPCNIERHSADELSHKEFLQRYAYSEPVIIYGIDNKKFAEKTQKSILLEDWGDVDVVLNSANTYSYTRKPSTISNYVENLQPQNMETLGNETMYLFGDIDQNIWKPLLDVYKIPEFTLPGHEPALSFGLAAAGTGVPYHFHGPGFAEVIHGAKRWFLHPFEERPDWDPDRTTLEWYLKDYPNLPREKKPLECLLKPGEVIYFPDKWWHATLNSRTSVSCSVMALSLSGSFRELILRSRSSVLCRGASQFTASVQSTPAAKPSGDPHRTFYAKDLQVISATGSQLRAKPTDYSTLPFGHVFSDHMLNIDWSAKEGWTVPRVEPLQDLRIHPAAKVLHYALELFEGMKAYRGVDGKLRIFRPELNMQRMVRSATRACLPTFDTKELTDLIVELVRVDKDWVPNSDTASLYMRPTLIATDPTLGVSEPMNAKLFVLTGPVGPYYTTGFKPVTLLADKTNVRAFPGGVGAFKMGCNYAPTIAVGKEAARKHGCQQIMWLYGEDEQITEAGTMNMFVLWKDKHGDLELVTPPLESGLILPGVTRQSLIELAREFGDVKVSERAFTMNDVLQALKEKRLLQMFGAGTAAVVSPVSEIVHRQGSEFVKIHIPTMDAKPNYMQKLYERVTDIQYGRVEQAGWTVTVEV